MGAGAYDLAAIRLQRWVSRVLPLLDQAVVCLEARMVLPAHGPRLPDSCPPLKRWDALIGGGSRLCRRSEEGFLTRLPHLLIHAATSNSTCQLGLHRSPGVFMAMSFVPVCRAEVRSRGSYKLAVCSQ